MQSNAQGPARHPSQQPAHRSPRFALACLLGLAAATLAGAAVVPTAGGTASLPVTGMFSGDQLSEHTKARLGDLIQAMQGSPIEVAVMVPAGPWITGQGGHGGERDLNAARLAALRAFMAERGVEAGRVFMESSLHEPLQAPRLDVQFVGRRGH